MLPWILVVVVSSGVGGALPFVLSSSAPPQAASQSQATFNPAGESVFVPFEQVVVNLDEGRLTRYLRLAITLQIAKSEEIEFQTRLARQKLLLKNWLLAHVSDKTLEDIRGGVGQNRLRREIRDHFNTVLYPDGYDRIYDVLFEEFNIQ